MLNPGDVVAGKLLVQLQLVPFERVREVLRAADQAPDAALDLVARLVEQGALAPEAARRVRRYQALFEHVRREAVFLRLLEKLDPPVPREEAHPLIARLEAERYRQRLGTILHLAGRLDAEQVLGLEERTRRRIQGEDLKVIERYRGEQFAGVARPLVPDAVVTTASFRISSLFRSKETLRVVDRLKAELLVAAAQPPLPAPAPVHELVPADVEEEVELDDDSKQRLVQMDTARLRKPDEAPPPVDLRALEEIGAYTVVECLGQGGMGAVFLAQEEGMGPIVAVKVMLAERAKAEDLARFEREAELSSRVAHRNVVNLIDRGRTDDGLAYMVIPFFAGKDLAHVLEEAGGRLEPEPAFDLFEQVLEGLSALHAAGIVHRDLKPENLFVLAGAERQVKIVDLGIARLMDDHLPAAQRLFRSRAGVVSGSPAYIAPETVSDDAIDARTDIYSLGVLFFQMLTGRLPIFGESAYDYLREHLVGAPLTLFQGKKDAHWSEALERLVACMLAKEKDERPASCAAILAQVRGGLRAEAVALYRNPPPVEAAPSGIFSSFFRRKR